MQLIKNASKEKLRGGFYTPEPIASFILKWAFNGNKELDILEPSCGDGVFLEEIQKGSYEYNSVTGIEFDEIEAVKSRKIGLDKSKIINSNFKNHNTDVKYDLIIGNPPHFTFSPTYGNIDPNEHRKFKDENWNIHKDFFKTVSNHITDDADIILMENTKGSNLESF